MELNFDTQGNLLPYRKTTLQWNDFVRIFADEMPDSAHRKRLLGNFAEFIRRFQTEIVSVFTVWVDGSFIGQKLNPRDIDAVFFLDYSICEKKKSVLDNYWFVSNMKFLKGLDLYYSAEYPASHKRYFLSHLNHLYWEDVYGHTRKDAFGRQRSKGFIELKFNESSWKN